MKISRLILWLVILIGLLFAVYAAATLFDAPVQIARVDNPRARITMTPEEATASQNPRGFQVLVSYTDSGFAPNTMNVKSGDTVRFTNNSRGQLWVAAGASPAETLYPGVLNGCGSSAFDSCYALSHGEYWEFTFDVSGDWSFSNRLNAAKTGTVHVSKK